MTKFNENNMLINHLYLVNINTTFVISSEFQGQLQSQFMSPKLRVCNLLLQNFEIGSSSNYLVSNNANKPQQ